MSSRVPRAGPTAASYTGGMIEWILIGIVVLAAVVLATHAAGVAFVVSRIVFSGRPKQKQWSPK
jgi:hypothetical protein